MDDREGRRDGRSRQDSPPATRGAGHEEAPGRGSPPPSPRAPTPTSPPAHRPSARVNRLRPVRSRTVARSPAGRSSRPGRRPGSPTSRLGVRASAEPRWRRGRSARPGSRCPPARWPPAGCSRRHAEGASARCGSSASTRRRRASRPAGTTPARCGSRPSGCVRPPARPRPSRAQPGATPAGPPPPDRSECRREHRDAEHRQAGADRQPLQPHPHHRLPSPRADDAGAHSRLARVTGHERHATGRDRQPLRPRIGSAVCRSPSCSPASCAPTRAALASPATTTGTGPHAGSGSNCRPRS